MTCPGMLSPSSPPEYTLILLGIAPAKVLAQFQCDPLVIGGAYGKVQKVFFPAVYAVQTILALAHAIVGRMICYWRIKIWMFEEEEMGILYMVHQITVPKCMITYCLGKFRIILHACKIIGLCIVL